MIEVMVPPAAEPVSLPDVYDHLRLGVGLTSHPDDKRLTRLIRSARQEVETHTRRALIQQQLRLTIDSRPARSGRGGLNEWAAGWAWSGDLPRPILLSVVAVQYFDADNIKRSVDLASYRVIGIGAAQGGRVEFVSGYTAPNVYARSDACSIVYTAGYPPSDDPGLDDDAARLRANVPEPIRDAILLTIDRAYNARLPAEDVMLDERVEALLATYRIAMP